MPFYAIEECKQCKTRLNRRATKTSEYIQARSSNERDNDSIIGSEVHEVWRRGDYRVRQLNGACSSRPRMLNLSFFFHNCFRKRPLSGFYVNCTVGPLSRSREVTTTTTTTTSVECRFFRSVRGICGKNCLSLYFFPFPPWENEAFLLFSSISWRANSFERIGIRVEFAWKENEESRVDVSRMLSFRSNRDVMFFYDGSISSYSSRSRFIRLPLKLVRPYINRGWYASW